MRRPLSALVGGLAVLVLLIGVGFAQTQAQEDQITISVQPTVFEIPSNPGDVIQESFKIVNGTDRDVFYTATPKNFTARGEEGSVDLTEDETGFSLASWITVTPEAVSVPARGSQVFDFTINVPPDAEPGGHFGSVIVQTDTIGLDGSGAQVAQEAGPLILVSVSGDIFEDAQIVDFAAQKSFWESGPVILETRVQNNGNVHFKPSGTIAIKNMFGGDVTTLNLEEKNVLPEAIRKVSNSWDPGFTVGRFTADLSVVYGANDTIITSSTSFIIFPYKIIIPAILGVILLLFVLIRYRSRVADAAKVLRGK
ncbi:MAG: hypothetical protein R3313_02920 [Candidatus Saccharimonadales bacterium]|nr:hypothetical protein [Candidatus Saccharimonadales bacterium]